MEALAAIGLVANILQFVSQAKHVYDDGKKLYEGLSGLTKENDAIRAQAQEVIHLSQSKDQHVSKLAREAMTTANEIIQDIEDLRVPSGGLVNALKGLRSSRKSHDKIAEKLKRLDTIQGDLDSGRIGVIRSIQEEMKSSLADIEQQTRTLQASQTKDIMLVKDQIAMVTKILLQPSSSPSGKQMFEQIKILQERLRGWDMEKERNRKHHAVLKSLQFNEIMARRDQISNAHGGTSRWIFTKQPHFTEWLEKQDDIFWISGIPGCGKSVLMKSLVESNQTAEHLQKWAGNAKVVVAGYYFWAAGTTKQKSQDGLLRSLLFDILRQCPELVDHVLPENLIFCPSESANDYPWSQTELNYTLRKVLSPNSSHRFCLFIDGLDEYGNSSEFGHDADEHNSSRSLLEIIELIDRLSKSSSLKICVSSRPWALFKTAYGQNPLREIKVHELNEDDIHNYVLEVLLSKLPNPIFRYIGDDKDDNSEAKTSMDLEKHAKDSHGSGDSEAAEGFSGEVFLLEKVIGVELLRVIEKVVEDSNGVFLWAQLVVQDLSVGLSNEDDIAILHDRLEKMPKSLPEYYKRTLETIDAEYLKDTVKIISTALYAESMDCELHILQYSYLWSHESNIDLECGFASDAKIPCLTEDAFHKRYRKSMQQFHARCPDFFRIHEAGRGQPFKESIMMNTNEGTVKFAHRTMQEYLRICCDEGPLAAHQDDSFNIPEFVAHSCLALCKTLMSQVWIQTIDIKSWEEPSSTALDSLFRDLINNFVLAVCNITPPEKDRQRALLYDWERTVVQSKKKFGFTDDCPKIFLVAEERQSLHGGHGFWAAIIWLEELYWFFDECFQSRPSLLPELLVHADRRGQLFAESRNFVHAFDLAGDVNSLIIPDAPDELNGLQKYGHPFTYWQLWLQTMSHSLEYYRLLEGHSTVTQNYILRGADLELLKSYKMRIKSSNEENSCFPKHNGKYTIRGVDGWELLGDDDEDAWSEGPAWKEFRLRASLTPYELLSIVFWGLDYWTPIKEAFDQVQGKVQEVCIADQTEVSTPPDDDQAPKGELFPSSGTEIAPDSVVYGPQPKPRDNMLSVFGWDIKWPRAVA